MPAKLNFFKTPTSVQLVQVGPCPLPLEYQAATSHTGRQPCRVKSLYMKRFWSLAYSSGEEREILLVQPISTCLRGALRGGGGQHPVCKAQSLGGHKTPHPSMRGSDKVEEEWTRNTKGIFRRVKTLSPPPPMVWRLHNFSRLHVLSKKCWKILI